MLEALSFDWHHFLIRFLLKTQVARRRVLVQNAKEDELLQIELLLR